MTARWYILFTLAAVLVTWTRLDSALFSLSLYILVTGQLVSASGSWRRVPWTWIAVSVAIAVTGAIIQFAFFYGAGGTLLPVSGLVKATGIGPDNLYPVWSRFISVVFPFTTFFSESSPVHATVAAAVFVSLLGLTLKNAARSVAPDRHLWKLAAALGVTIPVYALIVGGQHDPFWRWYLAPIFLFYMLAIAMTAVRAFSSLGFRPMHSLWTTAILCTVLPALFLLFLAATYRPFPLYQTRAQLGIFLKSVIPEETILASFNSGQVAFLSDRRMINLDGLVNSYGYLTDVFNKPSELIGYLRTNRVRYIVDYHFYWATDEIIANSEIKYAFAIPGDRWNRTIYVRKLK